MDDHVSISSDEGDDVGQPERVEYVNITLQTTTRFQNGIVSDVNRVVSLGYSDNFNPDASDNIDPLTVFRRIQEEFIYYVNQYGQQ